MFFLPLSGMSSSKAHCIVQHQKAPDLQLVSPKPRCGSSVYKLREQKRDVQQWTASLARRGRWNVAIVVSFSLSPHQREVVVIRSELLYFSSRIFLSLERSRKFSLNGTDQTFFMVVASRGLNPTVRPAALQPGKTETSCAFLYNSKWHANVAKPEK